MPRARNAKQQADRPARHGDGVLARQIGREFRLELLDRRTRGKALRIQNFEHGFEIALQQIGVAQRKKCRFHALAPFAAMISPVATAGIGGHPDTMVTPVEQIEIAVRIAAERDFIGHVRSVTASGRDARL